LKEAEASELMGWIKETLKDRVSEVGTCAFVCVAGGEDGGDREGVGVGVGAGVGVVVGVGEREGKVERGSIYPF